MEDFLDNLNHMNANLLQHVINSLVLNNENNNENSDNDKKIETDETLEDYQQQTLSNGPIYGCEHYLRRCKIVSPCCDKVYPCRLCHDEENFHNEKNYKKQHKLDRFKINQIICNNCNKIQAPQQYCENCHTCFGLYYCDICHLFDDIDKKQYHCYGCGFCRIGKDQFVHCDKCNMCVGKDNENHKCVDTKEYLCPICMIEIFTSTQGVTQMICGHWIHVKCFQELLQSTYKCPLCSMSVVKTDKMNEYIDQEINNTPMPDDYKDLCFKILCNDCHQESNVKFHILGLKCQHCKGYNTRKV